MLAVRQLRNFRSREILEPDLNKYRFFLTLFNHLKNTCQVLFSLLGKMFFRI